MDYFGKYGYAVIDSYNQLDMVQSIKVDDFLKKDRKREEWKNYYISSYSRGSFYPVWSENQTGENRRWSKLF